MDNKDRLFQEQDAPLKNTDGAFVKVNHDGTPRVPQSEEKNNDRKQEEADLEQQRKKALTRRD